MIYRAVQGNTRIFTNEAGKENNSKPFVGVGIFEREDSQTYTLLLKIEKNIDDAYFEASRIAELLNKNNTLFSRAEIENSQSKYHPNMETGNS